MKQGSKNCGEELQLCGIAQHSCLGPPQGPPQVLSLGTTHVCAAEALQAIIADLELQLGIFCRREERQPNSLREALERGEVAEHGGVRVGVGSRRGTEDSQVVEVEQSVGAL